MKLELPEELRLMRGTLRRFIDNEVIPYERESWNGSDLKPEFREKWEARAKELGIWQIDLPEEFGGMGLGLLARVVVWEEIGRTIAFPRRKPWVFGHDLSPILG
ncbi:MAG: acyl-CoA dehydrogenase family protein [Candidatus Latescibacterota bacterium]